MLGQYSGLGGNEMADSKCISGEQQFQASKKMTDRSPEATDSPKPPDSLTFRVVSPVITIYTSFESCYTYGRITSRLIAAFYEFIKMIDQLSE